MSKAPAIHVGTSGWHYRHWRMKKLREPEPALERYFERIRGLGSKLGPIVFQLPAAASDPKRSRV